MNVALEAGVAIYVALIVALAVWAGDSSTCGGWMPNPRAATPPRTATSPRNQPARECKCAPATP